MLPLRLSLLCCSTKAISRFGIVGCNRLMYKKVSAHGKFFLRNSVFPVGNISQEKHYASTSMRLHSSSSTSSSSSSSEPNPSNSKPTDDLNKQICIYRGSLASRMKAVKLFSLTTSIAGIFAQPILLEQGIKLGGTPMAIFLCSFGGFFTFVTPVLLHFVTKKYVTQIFYNPSSEEYTAVTISLLLQKVYTKFHPKDVVVPAVPGMFTSFVVNNRPLFIDPALFDDPEHYVRIMGYDKPIDFKLAPREQDIQTTEVQDKNIADPVILLKKPEKDDIKAKEIADHNYGKRITKPKLTMSIDTDSEMHYKPESELHYKPHSVVEYEAATSSSSTSKQDAKPASSNTEPHLGLNLSSIAPDLKENVKENVPSSISVSSTEKSAFKSKSTPDLDVGANTNLKELKNPTIPLDLKPSISSLALEETVGYGSLPNSSPSAQSDTTLQGSKPLPKSAPISQSDTTLKGTKSVLDTKLTALKIRLEEHSDKDSKATDVKPIKLTTTAMPIIVKDDSEPIETAKPIKLSPHLAEPSKKPTSTIPKVIWGAEVNINPMKESTKDGAGEKITQAVNHAPPKPIVVTGPKLEEIIAHPGFNNETVSKNLKDTSTLTGPKTSPITETPPSQKKATTVPNTNPASPLNKSDTAPSSKTKPDSLKSGIDSKIEKNTTKPNPDNK